MVKKISDKEYGERIRRIQNKLIENHYDAYLVHANEADFANVSYLCGHWPLFESAGVLVPKESEPILLVGPEAPDFAAESYIKNIRKMLEYRHSVEPDWLNVEASSFTDIFNEINNGKKLRKLALGSYTNLPVHIFDSLQKALKKEGEIIRADWIIEDMRMIKSEDEISLIQEAHGINERVFEDIINIIKPGITELECEGIIVDLLYKYGAEGLSFPVFVFGGERTRHLMGRTTHRVLKKGEMIQINFGARYGGYSSAIARPIFFGKMSDEIKKHVLFGLKTHRKVYEWIKPEVIAKDVYYKFRKSYIQNGYESSCVSGAGHGVGIMECEKPFIRHTSNYAFRENMIFMTDNFFLWDKYGFRWEDGLRVSKSGSETLSRLYNNIIEL